MHSPYDDKGFQPCYDSPSIMDSLNDKTMETAQFTPGPWMQDHRKGENGMYNTEVFTSDGQAIATLSWYPMPPEKGIREGKAVTIYGTYRDGNARLIAQAPDMYEALKKIAELEDDCEHQEFKLTRFQASQIARAALSKVDSTLSKVC